MFQCACVFVCEYFHLFMKIGAVDGVVSFRGDRSIRICTKQKPQISQEMNNFVCVSLSLYVCLFATVCVLCAFVFCCVLLLCYTAV